ncbi:hypothetical protein EXT68_02905 [Pectobacterium parmentieri]|uniref:Exported pilin protein n=1 Tax=Pectobacterium parmentieri TaxID=1905730 RepID=A0A0H3I6W2_PECPM|nr:hypothetical protein [Pectobacterium parmentieri]AFI89671.1 Exported pilin protein [Pectobacterium parmentieri]MBI0472092.1 hypothetical protein [Pectobacterium parmentieri]MBI0495201.1 hypothetical protein [Pectobacterium parmentieri]MBI0556253.1 hypothetical protein [Pectobacterium parmentieri]MBI0569337.1 hypothetical protein [Pectobacterium parmentieri]
MTILQGFTMKYFVFVLLFILGLPCYAGLYPVFVLEKTQGGSGNFGLLGHQELRELGTVTEFIPPPGKHITLGVKYYVGGKPYLRAHPAKHSIAVEKGETMGQAAKRAYDKWRAYNGIRTNVSNLSEACVAYALTDIPGGEYTRWESVFIPAGACLSTPPMPEWCSITVPEITLDHGVMRPGEGVKRVNQNVTMNCSGEMSVQLRLGQDKLQLAPGVVSNLSLPNTDHGRLNVTKGDTSTILTSELHLDGDVKPGSYRASTVLSVNYY